MTRFVGALGAVLVLGGLGHSAGVLRFYATAGLPDANRILLDIWIAEAQLIGGALYLTAFLTSRRRGAWRALSIFGALTIIGFGAAMLPALFARSPVRFRIPTLVYVACSVLVVAHATWAPRPQEEPAHKPLQPTSHGKIEGR